MVNAEDGRESPRKVLFLCGVLKYAPQDAIKE